MRLTDAMDAAVLRVVKEAHFCAFSVQSDFARANAHATAAAASIGFITTECPEGFGRRWRTTLDGHLFLKESEL